MKSVAGSGKSYLIGCTAGLLGDACFFLAPTGVSSLKIGRQTIHSAFKFPYCGSLEGVTNPDGENYESVPSDIPWYFLRTVVNVTVDSVLSSLREVRPSQPSNVQCTEVFSSIGEGGAPSILQNALT